MGVNRRFILESGSVITIFSVSGTAINGAAHSCLGTTRGGNGVVCTNCSLPGDFVIAGSGVCVDPLGATAVLGETRGWFLVGGVWVRG